MKIINYLFIVLFFTSYSNFNLFAVREEEFLQWARTNEDISQENSAIQKASAIDNWAKLILNSISTFKNKLNQIDRLSIDSINSIKSELQTKKEMVDDFMQQTQSATFQTEFGIYAGIPQRAVQRARKQLNTELLDLLDTSNTLFRTIPVD